MPQVDSPLSVEDFAVTNLCHSLLCSLLNYNISIKTRKELTMGGLIPFGGLIAGIITIAAGIIVLVWPRIIAYIVGIYLIIIGVIAVVTAL